MRVFFAMAAAALSCVAISGMSLSWDGSFYLFTIFDTQAPFAPNNRLIDIPLHMPVLAVARFTDNIALLQVVFGLTYSAITLLALILSWWIVREHNRGLFIWAALGVCFGTILLQCHPTNEGFLTILLAWPLFLAILTRLRPWLWPVVIVLCAAIFFAHPFATPVFAIASVFSVASAVRFKATRRKMLLWTFIFGLVTVLSILRFLLEKTGYETDQLSLDVVMQHVHSSMEGLPFAAMILAWLVAALIFAQGLVGARRMGKRVLPVLYGLELFSIVFAGLLLFIWAANLYNWRNQQDFRTLLLFNSAPFFLMAGLEALFHDVGAAFDIGNWAHRSKTAYVTVSIFFLVLVVQSGEWFDMKNRLEEVMTHSTWSCVSQASIPWIDGTPMRQWQLTSYSLLLQSKKPTSIIMSGDACGEQNITRGIYIYPTTLRQWGGRWFDLSLLHDRITAEQADTKGCSFSLNTGWYRTERNGLNWWRWSGGDATMKVLVANAVTAQLAGRIESISPGNSVDIMVNGSLQATISIAWVGMRTFSPVSILLKPGQNTLQFVSHNPPVHMTTGTRLLSLALGNISLVAAPGYQSCAMY